ncbi:hypothetical protein BJX99DRAFT_221028 [Aspergillus californicus]
MPLQSVTMRLSTTSSRALRAASASAFSRLPLRASTGVSFRFLSIGARAHAIRSNAETQAPNFKAIQSSTIRPFSSTSAVPSPSPTQSRSSPTSSGKSQADAIVEELQELYEVATDEFEIAHESTTDGTIYAASDRESARDALNALISAFDLYTTPNPNHAVSETSPINGQTSGGDGAIEGAEGASPLVELAFDPSDIEQGVREEVKKRVGQRVRELKSAVEGMEAKAHD